MRMYAFVPFQLSPIQKGIQAWHAGQELSNVIGETKDFKEWALKEKTIIILDGGTTNSQNYDVVNNTNYIGTLQMIKKTLEDNKVITASFFEPTMNNAETAVVCLVSEKVWNKEKYPDYKTWLKNTYGISDMNLTLETHRELWEKNIMSNNKRDIFLKDYLSQFKLAN